MFGSQNEFIAKIKEKTTNAMRSHCLIHQKALGSRTLLIAIKDKLPTIVRSVNYVKESYVNTKLFTKLCKDKNSKHKTLLFHTSFRCLSKVNMLARTHKIKNKFILFFEVHGKQDLLLLIKSKKFHLTLAHLMDIFEALSE